MIKILVSHGCPDITETVNERESQTLPRAFGGFGDIYYGKLYDTSAGDVAIKCARFSADENISRRALKVCIALTLYHNAYFLFSLLLESCMHGRGANTIMLSNC